MGLFDRFKKQKNSQTIQKRTNSKIKDQKNEFPDTGIYDLAFALARYKESKRNYIPYKRELKNYGFDDSEFIFNSIGIVLHYYYTNDKDNALKLYRELNEDYPKNVEITWLFIEVINLINIENDRKFVKKYLDYKKLKNDFNYHYQTEYQRGLELKSMGYFKEAINHWTSLNNIQEFSWNYYQIGILQNVIGNDNYLSNLKKGIEMDSEIKEDAKSYHELNNLRGNIEFLKLLE